MELLANIIDLFMHLDKHLSEVIRTYGGWTYALLFLVIFLETGVVITPFLPGDSLLFAAGALAATGALNVFWIYLLVTMAAILGDTVNYWVGHAVGPRAFQGNIRFLKKEYLERTQRFYDKHGGKTIVLARFIPIIRTFAPFVAGIGSMSYSRFITYNVTGGVLWTTLFVWGGYYFGNLPVVKRNFSLVILAIIFLSLLPPIIEFVQNYRRRKTALGKI